MGRLTAGSGIALARSSREPVWRSPALRTSGRPRHRCRCCRRPQPRDHQWERQREV